MSIEFPILEGEKAMGLMSPMILGSETPVNGGKNGFIIVVDCAEDSAAYGWFSLSRGSKLVKNGVYTLLVHF